MWSDWKCAGQIILLNTRSYCKNKNCFQLMSIKFWNFKYPTITSLVSSSLSPLPVSFSVLLTSLSSHLLLSPQFGKDLVPQTHSNTITTPPRRPLMSPFSSLPLYPSSDPSTQPSIATIPGLRYPTPGPARVSLPTTQLCVCVLTSVFLPVFLTVRFD